MLFVLNITKMYFSGQNPLKVTLSRKTITGTHAPYVMYEIQQVQTVSGYIEQENYYRYTCTICMRFSRCRL